MRASTPSAAVSGPDDSLLNAARPARVDDHSAMNRSQRRRSHSSGRQLGRHAKPGPRRDNGLRPLVSLIAPTAVSPPPARKNPTLPPFLLAVVPVGGDHRVHAHWRSPRGRAADRGAYRLRGHRHKLNAAAEPAAARARSRELRHHGRLRSVDSIGWPRHMACPSPSTRKTTGTTISPVFTANRAGSSRSTGCSLAPRRSSCEGERARAARWSPLART
jgi:hypothetical protein